MSTTQTRHDERNHYSPKAEIHEHMPRGLAIVLAVCGILGLVLGVAAYIRATVAEREARIIEDDTKYIRAYLSARGIHIPANHEEAEER